MEIKNLTDEQLVKLAQNNNAEATCAIIERYKKVINGVIRSFFLIGGDAEDLFQEGMISVFRAVCTYNGKTSFSAYAYKCIKNCVITAIRKTNREKDYPLRNYLSLSNINEGNEDKSDIIEDNSFDPELHFINGEEEARLQSNLKKILSSLEYDILNLYLKGYSYQEIGESKGKSTKSVDNAIQRIRSKINKLFYSIKQEGA